MSSGSMCEECGMAIPADSPGKFCARCLLGLALGEDQSPESKVEGPDGGGGESVQSPKSEVQRPQRSAAGSLTEKPGDRIGRYQLLEEIGHGGCGVVYMAEQKEPVRRRVALKVIKLGMDTRQVVARFEAERQALAMMDHPNIAKVLDAGATETGRPYFVMELVGGIKITDYCNQNQLSTRERVGLFMQVCRAIQHAHQKGIIHRDIKPSNVLVATHDGAAVPKVIDFGIAKATQGKLTDQTLFTAFEQFIGTPAYMSPEQAQLGGLDIDTRSDIYSLGVLLYELLTGATPFDTKELVAAGLDEMRRTIREVEAVKPSTRLTQGRNAQKAGRVAAPAPVSGENAIESGAHGVTRPTDKYAICNPQSAIPSDLDWIVMKCLEKDRARRYETASGLARDIERHLNNEPVQARPRSKLYEFQQTVRRHKFGFAAAAGIIIVLMVGVTASTWQAIRARKAERDQRYLRQQAQTAQANEARERQKVQTEAAKSQQIATFLQEMLKSVGPSVAAGRDTEMLREILDKAAVRVGTELTNQPEVEVELDNTIAFAYWELGDHEKTEAMYRRSLQLLRKTGTNDNATVAYTLHNLAFLLFVVGDDTTIYKYEEAEQKEREALAIYEKVNGREHPAFADSLHGLACVLAELGKLEAAEAAALESVAITRKLFDVQHPNIGTCLGQLGTVLVYQGRLDAAEPVYQEAVMIFRKAAGNNRAAFSGLSPYVELAWSLYGQAGLRGKQGKWDKAAEIYGEALAMLQKVQGKEHRDVVRMTTRLADALAAQGQFAEGEKVLSGAVSDLKLRLASGKRSAFDRQLMRRLVKFYETAGRLDEAAKWKQQIAELEKGEGKPNAKTR